MDNIDPSLRAVMASVLATNNFEIVKVQGTWVPRSP
jgi:hypothetical protein